MGTEYIFKPIQEWAKFINRLCKYQVVILWDIIRFDIWLYFK